MRVIMKGFVNINEVDFNDERAVLKAALENEVKGRKLYTQYANTVKNEMARRVFVQLANEELTHIEDIQKFLQASDDFGEINVKSMTSQDSVRHAREIFGKLVSEMEGRVSASDDDNESRDVAMEFEKNGYEYYKLGAKATKNEKLKSFLTWLMEQEQSHYMFIQNAFEYMNNPESWYAGEEHWLLEG
ncbi:MAG: ferritin family protein [Candidatus Aenigmatarchaeota archaeon]|nr:MAG: ferritin family protein [Candidatus Aenigmarchaeota archaeon]